MRADIPGKIRDARKMRKMTQEELSQKINVNRATISRYESGNIDLTIDQLIAIADALEINVSFFTSPNAPSIESAKESYQDWKHSREVDDSIVKLIESLFGDRTDLTVESNSSHSFMNIQSYGTEGKAVCIDDEGFSTIEDAVVTLVLSLMQSLGCDSDTAKKHYTKVLDDLFTPDK